MSVAAGMGWLLRACLWPCAACGSRAHGGRVAAYAGEGKGPSVSGWQRKGEEPAMARSGSRSTRVRPVDSGPEDEPEDLEYGYLEGETPKAYSPPSPAHGRGVAAI